MSLAPSFRKHLLTLEIRSLVSSLHRNASGIVEPTEAFSDEAMAGLSIEELQVIREDLRDIVRSLGGSRGKA